MPFIDSKITVPVTSELKEEIKSELGKLITTLGKSETYLMVGIEEVTYHPVNDWGWNGSNF